MNRFLLQLEDWLSSFGNSCSPMAGLSLLADANMIITVVELTDCQCLFLVWKGSEILLEL